MAASRSAGALLWLALPGLVSCALAPRPGARSGPDIKGAVKATGLASRAPHDPVLSPRRGNAASLARLRLTASGRPSERVGWELAYEQRARLATAGAAAGQGILPAQGGAPYRIRELDWPLIENGASVSWRHEIDRALVALHPEWGEVVIGRQAIGLGRGVIFSSVDVFSPFAPAEVDREWRRGVDAVRAEYRLSDTASAELLGVFGRTCDDSALLGRLRGYVGEMDAEIIVGKRARDLMLGTVVSAVVGESELHAELAFFRTPEAQPGGGVCGDDRLVAKAVLGASHTFDIGTGLTLLGEYHYSGFGVRDARNAAARLASPTFRQRFLRGDMQIVGRHGAAVQASYQFSQAWTGALLVLLSPRDGSGLISPSVTWDVARNTSILAAAFVPWGPGPSGGGLRSEYGATPLSLLVQFSFYF